VLAVITDPPALALEGVGSVEREDVQAASLMSLLNVARWWAILRR
jgi:hypothetical protein